MSENDEVPINYFISVSSSDADRAKQRVMEANGGKLITPLYCSVSLKKKEAKKEKK